MDFRAMILKKRDDDALRDKIWWVRCSIEHNWDVTFLPVLILTPLMYYVCPVNSISSVLTDRLK